MPRCAASQLVLIALGVLERPCELAWTSTGPGGDVLGTFTGRAEPMRLPTGDLRVDERGTLVTPDGRSAGASSAYVYRSSQGGRGLSVGEIDRPDGANETICTLRTSGERELEGDRAFLCGHDVYTLRARVLEGTLELLWTVRGPKKDCLIRKRYTPAGEAAPRPG